MRGLPSTFFYLLADKLSFAMPVIYNLVSAPASVTLIYLGYFVVFHSTAALLAYRYVFLDCDYLTHSFLPFLFFPLVLSLPFRYHLLRFLDEVLLRGLVLY